MKLQGIITATVAVILIMLVAVPLIDSSSESIESKAQNVEGRYMITSSTEPTTITFSSGGVYTVNGQEIDDSTYNYQIKVFCDQFMIAFNTDAATANLYAPNIPGVYYNITKLEFTPESNKVVLTPTSGSTIEYTIERLFYLHPSGEYGYYFANTDLPIHVTNGNEWYLLVTGFTQPSGTAWGAFKYTGTESEVYMQGFGKTSTSESSYSLGDVVVTIQTETADSKHFDITGISDVTFSTATFNGGICKIVAPIEYIEISENDNIVLTLLGLIPVLLIAALLIGIGYSIMRRD